MYRTDELVRIAKREKNRKRSYLFVNPLQGKHIPANPEEVDRLCKCLAEEINKDYSDKRKMVIGFAETATGISAAVCVYLNNVVFFEHTTREYRDTNEYIYFTESHSHAKAQLLDMDGLDKAVSSVDMIILIDDEITTGNTVCKLIDQIKEKYSFSGELIIASFVNSMTDERITELKSRGIECEYVIRIPHEYKAELAEKVDEISNPDCEYDSNDDKIAAGCVSLSINPRKPVLWEMYLNDMQAATDEIIRGCDFDEDDTVCIIGTEEFMFLTICLGKNLIQSGIVGDVKIHSTTRSPIIPSSQEGYPLNSRYKLISFYEKDRVTYIYNLAHYDKVIVVTDGITEGDGIRNLVSVIKSVGNKSVYVYGCEYEK
ncbi:phosphoribosyltransferase domain-containing protein [Butyrivibrio sp. VCB2001]|uniref:phosphoribosyltransferase domain-containing protein n=1 Tax=Butyrivibrio sp. VCB2001 TaxID=1280667 RepID=UPI00040B1DCA|nr:phosphoribosyltransferase domain-containing protein [Butyrivibrio sp. VCB2001]